MIAQESGAAVIERSEARELSSGAGRTLTIDDLVRKIGFLRIQKLKADTDTSKRRRQTGTDIGEVAISRKKMGRRWRVGGGRSAGKGRAAGGGCGKLY